MVLRLAASLWFSLAATSALAACDSQRGNYGFLSNYGEQDQTKIKDMIDFMMDELCMRDIQFQDWFANYAGQFQSFDNGGPSQKSKNAQPRWWSDLDSWTPPWAGPGPIYKDNIKFAVSYIKSKGGTPWAYIPMLATEFWNLACPVDAPDVMKCTTGSKEPNPQAVRDPTFPSSQFWSDPIYVASDPGFFKLLDAGSYWSDPKWFIQEDQWRKIPTYFIDKSLGKYMMDAWYGIVREFGFTAIQWDTYGPIAGDRGAETTGIHEFLSETKRLMTTAKDVSLTAPALLQAYNNINMEWFNDHEAGMYEDQYPLAFVYSEVWSATAENKFYEKVKANSLKAAVIANYPGNYAYTGTCKDGKNGWHDKEWLDNCWSQPFGPSIHSAEELANVRWKAAASRGTRYLVAGQGRNRLKTEYFPAFTPIEDSLVQTIKANPPVLRNATSLVVQI